MEKGKTYKINNSNNTHPETSWDNSRNGISWNDTRNENSENDTFTVLIEYEKSKEEEKE